MTAYIEQYIAQLKLWLTLLQSWWLALPPEQQVGYALLFITGWISAELALFILKNSLIFIMRRIGLSSPELYGVFPRTLPWRSLLKIYLAFSRWREMLFKFGKVSTGGFASVLSTLTNLNRKNTLLLGIIWLWGFRIYQPIGVKLNKHVLVIAGTGSGKTSSMIASIENWNGSAFIIDPTGIINGALAAKDIKRIWITLEPYSNNSAQINPFDDLKDAQEREGENAAVTWAYRIGQSFIPTSEGSKQPYFTDASRGMFVGLVLHVLTAHPEAEHHLGTVRDLITYGYRVFTDDGALDSTPDEARQLLYKMMLDNPSFEGAVAGAAAPFINASSETRGNLESTLQERTKVLDIPSVRRFFKRTTMPLSVLKTRNDVVFTLNIPLYSLREELRDVARLIQNLVCYTFESVKPRKGTCLMVVDEVQAQGYNQSLEISLPVARSQGLLIVAITQDVEGLKASYPKTYQGFIGGADVVLWMGSAHPQNLTMLSQILGKKTIIEKDKHTSRKSYRDVEVMSPEQIGRFLDPTNGNMIVTRAGKRAWRLKIDPYFTALPVWRYCPDPDHSEALMRRISRFVLSPFIRKSKQSTKENRHDKQS